MGNKVEAATSKVTAQSPEALQSRPVGLGPRRVPWYISLAVLAAVGEAAGLCWDISWHMSIGRDSFWNPGHVMMGLFAAPALWGGGLILFTTFGRGAASARREASVKVLGFRGPLGAFVWAWAGVVGITGFVFDNWWHLAYGLDVKPRTPPHVVLVIGGMFVSILGTLVMIMSLANRSAAELREKLSRLALVVCGLMIVIILPVVLDSPFNTRMHNGSFYRTVSVVVPLILVAGALASGRRRPFAVVTGGYTVWMLAYLWILPLFPAQPRLGPVMHPIDHFVPLEFPILLIVPAVVLDLLWPRVVAWHKWSQAALVGCVFLAMFFAAQWPLATFLVTSPAGRSRLFGDTYGFYFPSQTGYARLVFDNAEPNPLKFGTHMVEALVGAILSTRMGLAVAELLRRVRR